MQIEIVGLMIIRKKSAWK